MTTSRTIILLLVTAVVVTTWILPCSAEHKEKDKENIWIEEEPRGPGPGPGPGRGPGFELTDEEVNRILNSLKQSDPNAIKELEKLRKEDPEKFQAK